MQIDGNDNVLDRRRFDDERSAARRPAQRIVNEAIAHKSNLK
jgi:hypothetical protein